LFPAELIDAFGKGGHALLHARDSATHAKFLSLGTICKMAIDKQWVVRELECLSPVRLQPEGSPHAMDGGRRVTDRFGHRTQRPVRRAVRRCLQGPADRIGDLVVADLAWRAGPWLVKQPVQPAINVPSARAG
jgi:hypothetical protein